MPARRSWLFAATVALALAPLALCGIGCSRDAASPIPAGIVDPHIVGYPITPDASMVPSSGPASISLNLDGPTGGTVTLGAFSVYFPPKAVKGPYTVTMTIPDPTLLACDLSIAPGAANKFGKPVTLTFNYVGTDATAPLTAIWYNPSSGLWESIGGTDSPTTLTYSVQLSHFSQYALSGGRAGW